MVSWVRRPAFSGTSLVPTVSGWESTLSVIKYFVYVLLSEVCRKTYVGQSVEPDVRLGSHNAGKVRSTKHCRPWRRIFLQECRDKDEATKVELWFKSRAGRRRIAELLEEIGE